MATKEDETVAPTQGALKGVRRIFTPWRAWKWWGGGAGKVEGGGGEAEGGGPEE